MEADMECSRYREPLDLVPSFDCCDPVFTPALDHANICPPCRERLASRLKSEYSIKLTMEASAPVPESLNLFVKNMPSEKMSPGRWMVRYGVIAASILLMATSTISSYRYWQSYKMEAAVEQLRLFSVKNHEIRNTPEFLSDDEKQVAQWLSGRLNKVVQLPKNLKPGSVVGASPSALGEHPVGAVHLVIDGNRSTLYTFDPSPFGVNGAVKKEPSYEMGHTVAAWEEHGVGYSLVSDAPVESMRASFVSGAMR